MIACAHKLCYSLCMKPVNKHVLVTPVTGPEKHKSGLYLPTESKSKVPMGEVVATDTDIVKVGETIYYRKWTEIDELHLVEAEDVLAVKE